MQEYCFTFSSTITKTLCSKLTEKKKLFVYKQQQQRVSQQQRQQPETSGSAAKGLADRRSAFVLNKLSTCLLKLLFLN
jgi:hypothetical protein